MTASQALDSLDTVKCYAEIHGDKQMNVMLNELIRKVKTLKLQNVRQSTNKEVLNFLSNIHMFFKKWSFKPSQLT